MNNPDPLESWSGLVQQIENLFARLVGWFQLIIEPWGLLQLLLIVVVAALAWFGGRPARASASSGGCAPATPRCGACGSMRSSFAASGPSCSFCWRWLPWLPCARSTSPDRSHLVLIAANLVAVWVIVSITSRFIRNRLAARIVAVGAWLIAALNILNLAQTATAVLDAAAVNLGDVHVSLLLLLKAGAGPDGSVLAGSGGQHRQRAAPREASRTCRRRCAS